MKINKYYDKQAGEYYKKFSSGTLGVIKQKEVQNVMAVLDVRRGEEILDAGCGVGFYSIAIKNRGGQPFGIDISEKMIRELKKNDINGVVANLGKFDLNKKFDKILSAGAFEFCKNHTRILANFKNHLKENGDIVLLVPRVSIVGVLYFLYHLKSGIKITLFSHKYLKKLVAENNMRINLIKKQDALTDILKLSVNFRKVCHCEER